MGRYGLSLKQERNQHGEKRFRLTGPPQETQGQPNAGKNLKGERTEIESPRKDRACLRRAKGPRTLLIRTASIS